MAVILEYLIIIIYSFIYLNVLVKWSLSSIWVSYLVPNKIRDELHDESQVYINKKGRE